MKKLLTTALILALSVFLFAACAENKEVKSTPDEAITRPATGDEPTIPADKFRPVSDFAGTYRNDAYTAQITKDEDDELTVTITSPVQDNKSIEWTLSGLLSNINYKVHYDNAVKTVITYNDNGKEISRDAAYENGTGRLIFDDNKAFTWENGMERIEDNQFTREK